VPAKRARKRRGLLEAFAHAGGENVEEKKFAKKDREAFGS